MDRAKLPDHVHEWLRRLAKSITILRSNNLLTRVEAAQCRIRLGLLRERELKKHREQEQMDKTARAQRRDPSRRNVLPCSEEEAARAVRLFTSTPLREENGFLRGILPKTAQEQGDPDDNVQDTT